MWKIREGTATWLIAGVTTLLALHACAPDDVTGVKQVSVHPARSVTCTTLLGLPGDGEIYGNLYLSGTRLCGEGSVTLSAPGDERYSSNYKSSLDLDGELWSWQFWDPSVSSQCDGWVTSAKTFPGTPRSEDAYHDGSGGTEGHCVNPGPYSYSGPYGRALVLDYLQKITGVTDAGHSSASLYITSDEWDINSSGVAIDLLFNQDSGGTYTNTGVLEIDTTESTFTNRTSPTGRTDQTFRFSPSQSTTTWNHDAIGGGFGNLFARLTYGDGLSTNWFQLHAGDGAEIAREHSYDSVDPGVCADTVTKFVDMYLLNPAEASPSTGHVQRGILLHTPRTVASHGASINGSTTVELGLGGTATAKDTLLDSYSTNPHCAVTWISRNTGKATVNSSGIVTAVDTGVVRIVGSLTAKGTTYADSVSVTVVPAPVLTDSVFRLVGCTNTTHDGGTYNHLHFIWTTTIYVSASWTWNIRMTEDSTDDPASGSDEGSGTGDPSSSVQASDEFLRGSDDPRYFWLRYANGAVHTGWFRTQSWYWPILTGNDAPC